ncbi:MAG: C45 family peptidase [Acidobacteriota bacterium]
MPVERAISRDWLRSQVRITWHLPAVLGCLALGLLLAVNWNWLTSSRPAVCRLAGSHFEMGLMQGRAFRQEIGRLFADYIIGGLVQTEGWQLEDLIEVGRHYEAFIPSSYREEMRGIAEGSGIPYDHILVMNTFPDAVLGATPRACSAFAVRTTRGLLVARNLDWTNYGVAHRYGIVQLLQPRDGHRVLNIGWPGMVGVVTGMNDQGLVITLNMAYAIDLDTKTTPLLIRLREVLERQTSIQEAVDSLTRQPRTFAANVLIASSNENNAVVLELSGKRHAIVEMRERIVVTTNFFQALDIRGGTGGDRSDILTEVLRRTADYTTLRDARGALSKVCFRGSSLGMATVQSAVFEPRRLLAHVATGKLPASSGRYYEIRLSP